MNFQKVVQCTLTVILIITIAFAGLTYARAEEPEFYDDPQTEQPAPAADSTVSVHDDTVSAKLDAMQETLDNIAIALAPVEDTENQIEAETEPTPAPVDYSAQLETITAQLAELQQAVQTATPETAEPAFQKPFNDYSVSEVLLLVLVAVAAVFLVLNFIRTL